MKYDVETLEADLLALVQTNLPAKIAQIEAEKADSITLEVPKNAQYFNSTDDKVDNRRFAVQYGLTGSSPVSISSNTAKDCQFIFLVYLDPINKKQGIARIKLFRYIRALEEIFEENFDRVQCVSNLNIITIAPSAWAENENSPVLKVGGVYVETSLAS